MFFICNSSQNKWCVYRAYCNIQHQHYTHCRHPSNTNIIHIADIHPTSTLYTLQTSIQVEKIRVKMLSKWINKIWKTRKLNYHKFVKPGTKTAHQNCAGNRFGEREKYVFLKNKSKNWSVSFNDGYNENELLPKINHCDVTNVIIFTTKVIYKYWHIFSLYIPWTEWKQSMFWFVFQERSLSCLKFCFQQVFMINFQFLDPNLIFYTAGRPITIIAI